MIYPPVAALPVWFRSAVSAAGIGVVEVLTGTIRSIEVGCRWGFIQCPAFRNDVFFHRQELLLADLTDDVIGKRVAFELGKSERGLRAVNVTILD